MATTERPEGRPPGDRAYEFIVNSRLWRSMIRSGYPSRVPNKEDLTQLQLLIIVHKLAQGLRDFEACYDLLIFNRLK